MKSSDLLAMDIEARERIASDLNTSFLVEAAAGTGKTTALVGRLVAVLAEGVTNIDQVVAVTFTRKAAGELKLRLRIELEQARVQPDLDDLRRGRIEEALSRLEEATIGTIHSFCAEILHERPIAAGIDPGFSEYDAEQAESLHQQAFRSWIQRRLDSPTTTLQRALARLAHPRTWITEPPLERLRRAALSLLDWRDFDHPWTARPIDLMTQINQIAIRVDEVATLSLGGGPSDPLFRSLQSVRDLAEWIERSESEGPRDYPTLEARIHSLAHQLGDAKGRGRGANYATDLTRADMLTAKIDLLDLVEEFVKGADGDLAVALYQELQPVTSAYDQAKRDRGALDFLDLLLLTRDLLVNEGEIRAYFQNRYTHLFVDEFQDTDPIQAEILLLLAAENPQATRWNQVRPRPGKLFLVGDPKQSIYRFRRADVRFYQRVQDHLISSGVELLYLARSFRAVAPLQEAVNAAFAAPMTEDRDAGQAAYVPLLPVRDSDAEHPSLIALPVPSPYGVYSLSKAAVEASLPNATGAFIQWLVEDSGWQIENPENQQKIAIQPHHICLLFRRFLGWKTDVTNGYVRALEVRGLPHVLVGGRSLHHREEVDTLRVALTAIEWPEDELAVYATLKGSLFSILDEKLFLYRMEGGKLDPLAKRIAGDGHNEVRQALDMLAGFHHQRNQVAIASTLERLLSATRAHAGFLLRPAGRQALANLDHLRSLSRAWERRGGSSFRAFVEYLVHESESLATRQPAVFEETDEGVRLMTVHAAKGLEFPIVILADPTTNATRPASITVDPEHKLCAQRILDLAPPDLLDRQKDELARDQAEAVRVTYVAATRARDLMVVPVVGDLDARGNVYPATSWLAPLAPALYPNRERFSLSVVANACPPFGSTSVPKRPSSQDGEQDGSVHPGIHQPQLGSHKVLWWDPAVLDLEVESHFGVAQASLLSPPETGDGGLLDYQAWRKNRRKQVQQGSVPSRRVVAISDLDNLSELPRNRRKNQIEVMTSRGPEKRPHGARFGTLVHSILRDTPLDAGPDQLTILADYYRRIHQATDAEAEAAIRACTNALQHPLIASARTAERLEREYPFLHRCQDGTILDGVVDMFFVTEGTATLVDFKTDLSTGEIPDRYRVQMAWYEIAVGTITQSPVRSILLSV